MCHRLTTLRSLLWLPLLSLWLLCGYAAAWTSSEWEGVVSAVLGVQVLKSEVVPNVSDVCDNCLGTGKVGDGTVFVTCAACDGTGKRKKEGHIQKDKEVLSDKSASTFRVCGRFG